MRKEVLKFLERNGFVEANNRFEDEWITYIDDNIEIDISYDEVVYNNKTFIINEDIICSLLGHMLVDNILGINFTI